MSIAERVDAFNKAFRLALEKNKAASTTELSHFIRALVAAGERDPEKISDAALAELKKRP